MDYLDPPDVSDAGIDISLRVAASTLPILDPSCVLSLLRHLSPALNARLPGLVSTTDIARPLIPIGLHVYSSLLFPILHHLWLHAGSANANFFYAAGLVAGLGNVISGVEVVWVGRKRQFERSEGVKEGWKVVQVTD